jgi:hypothetical protein
MRLLSNEKMSLWQGLITAVGESLRVILETLENTPFPRFYGRTESLDLIPAGDFITFRVFPSNDTLADNLAADRRQLVHARFDTLPPGFSDRRFRTYPLHLRVAFHLCHLTGLRTTELPRRFMVAQA